MNKEERIKKLEYLRNEKKPYKQDEVIYKGEKSLMDVYKIPLDNLIYNKYNGRILSMTKSFERQFRELNPERPEDVRIIEEFLWDSKPDRNKTTMKDLRKWGQKRIGIVTKDGIIIDGNRRASLLNKIRREDKDGRDYFNAVILDDTLEDNPREIMRLETTYQMGEDEKLDYNPIEKYLKCKDLQNVGFTAGDIGKMMGEKESRINEWLSIMKLMDDFLDDLGYTGIYTRLDRTEGQFVDLNKYLNKYESGTSLPGWNYKKQDIADLKVICFDYIRARYEGKEFRDIGLPGKEKSFFCSKNVWEKFRDSHFENIDPINNNEPTVEQLRSRDPKLDLSDVLKVRDADWKRKAKEQLETNLQDSKRTLEDIVEANTPTKLLKRALNTLESVSKEVLIANLDDEAKKLLEKIKLHIKYLESSSNSGSI